MAARAGWSDRGDLVPRRTGSRTTRTRATGTTCSGTRPRTRASSTAGGLAPSTTRWCAGRAASWTPGRARRSTSRPRRSWPATTSTSRSSTSATQLPVKPYVQNYAPTRVMGQYAAAADGDSHPLAARSAGATARPHSSMARSAAACSIPPKWKVSPRWVTPMLSSQRAVASAASTPPNGHVPLGDHVVVVHRLHLLRHPRAVRRGRATSPARAGSASAPRRARSARAPAAGSSAMCVGYIAMIRGARRVAGGRPRLAVHRRRCSAIGNSQGRIIRS